MHPTKYPMTGRVRAAIEALFDNPSAAYGALGVEQSLSSEWYKMGDLPASPKDRAVLLRRKMEGCLVQMAEECAEYANAGETARLRSEAVGILIALRELVAYLPESAEDS